MFSVNDLGLGIHVKQIYITEAKEIHAKNLDLQPRAAKLSNYKEQVVLSWIAGLD